MKACKMTPPCRAGAMNLCRSCPPQRPAAAPPRLNACHNRAPFLGEMVVQDGWYHREGADTRLPRMVTIPFRMRSDCVYSTDPLVGSKDLGCVGCRWKQKVPA